MNWPVFFKRLGSAIVFTAVMMTGLLYPDVIGIFLLAFLIQYLCLREFLRLCEQIFPDGYFPNWIHPVTQAVGLLVMYCLTLTDPVFSLLGVLVPSIIFIPAVLSKNTALKAAFCALSGILYISIPLGLLVALRSMHIAIPIALILMIWMNDTMAYLTGSFFGRTPFSKISPNKTWEGTLGGIVFTILGAAVWANYAAKQPLYENFYKADWYVMAIIVCIAGTAGDLLESKLKRMANVKDSGVMMPGHGGALDRFDSLLMAVPFVFVYLWISINFISA